MRAMMHARDRRMTGDPTTEAMEGDAAEADIRAEGIPAAEGAAGTVVRAEKAMKSGRKCTNC
jgi:hypothetical protein